MLTFCLKGNFLSFFCFLLIFFKVSNSWDPDQARSFVGPDHAPNCLQKLLADPREQRVNLSIY